LVNTVPDNYSEENAFFPLLNISDYKIKIKFTNMNHIRQIFTENGILHLLELFSFSNKKNWHTNCNIN